MAHHLPAGSARCRARRGEFALPAEPEPEEPFDPRSVYVAGGRLRRRHLVRLIADTTGHTLARSAGILDHLDDLVIDVMQHERPILLPGIDLTDLFRLDPRPPWLDEPVSPVTMVELAPRLARRATITRAHASVAIEAVERMILEAGDEVAVYIPGWGYEIAEAAREEFEDENLQEALEVVESIQRPMHLFVCHDDSVGHLGHPVLYRGVQHSELVEPGDRTLYWLGSGADGAVSLGVVMTVREGNGRSTSSMPKHYELHQFADLLDWHGSLRSISAALRATAGVHTLDQVTTARVMRQLLHRAR